MILLKSSLICLFMIVGTFFILMAAIGIYRFPDAYTRAHAASKSSTLGILFLLIAVFLYFLFMEHSYNARILLGIAFLFLTAPIGGHLLTRAAYFSGVQPSERTKRDELKPIYEEMKKEQRKNRSS